MLRAAYPSSLTARLCIAIVVVACDETFDPVAPSPLAFSVWGNVDAGADTQLIRVMPIRSLRATTPDPLAATVTLEQLGTGRIIRLTDSIFSFTSRSDRDRDLNGEWIQHSLYVHNSWTTEAIEPGATYRFSAIREGKEPAEAVVEVPPDYDVTVAISQAQLSGIGDELRITGVKHLPFLTELDSYDDDCGSDVYPIRWEGRSADDETYVLALEKQGVPSRSGCGETAVRRRELWMVGSEAPWPAGGYSETALGDSALASNVTNAVGFLGGVFSKRIPYEDCAFQSEGAPIPLYCELRYGPNTATILGYVHEYRGCVGPIDSATVRLTELGRDPARVRTFITPPAGTFAIGALEPGIPHSLLVRAPRVVIDSEWVAATSRWRPTAWWDFYRVRTDTLTFTPGQRLQYDVELERLVPCGKAAAVVGIVSETRCGDGPIASATVRLTRIRDTTQFRNGRSDADGKYVAGGLVADGVPGELYSLWARAPDVVVDSIWNPVTGRWDPVPGDIHTQLTDTLRVVNGQIQRYDVHLERLTSCSEPPPGGR